MPSKNFHDLMKECLEIHDRKSHDYASDKNPFSNFEGAAEIVEQFAKPIDQVFAGIIGIKLTRLAQLLNGKIPLNESIDDTFKDAVNYFALWGAYYRNANKNVQIQTFIDDDMKILEDFVPGQMVPIKSTDELPDICTDCNLGNSTQKINHALTMHSATFNKAQSILKYPTKGMYLLEPGFWKDDKKPTGYPIDRSDY